MRVGASLSPAVGTVWRYGQYSTPAFSTNWISSGLHAGALQTALITTKVPPCENCGEKCEENLGRVSTNKGKRYTLACVDVNRLVCVFWYQCVRRYVTPLLGHTQVHRSTPVCVCADRRAYVCVYTHVNMTRLHKCLRIVGIHLYVDVFSTT